VSRSNNERDKLRRGAILTQILWFDSAHHDKFRIFQKSLNIIFALIFLACSPLRAQDATELTLDKCISLAFQQSFPMQNAVQQFIASKKSYEAQALSSATSVDLSLIAPSYNESLVNQFNSTSQQYEYYQLQTTVKQSTLSIKQPLFMTGGTLSMNGYVIENYQASLLSTTTNYFSNFQLSLDQPLFYPNTLKINREQAHLHLDQAYSNFQKDQLDVIYQVKNAFYAAYKLSQQEEISRDQVKQNEETYTSARSKYSAGLIPEVDLLQSEVDLATSKDQNLSNRSDASRAKNALKIMLGLPIEKEVLLVASLHYDSIAIDEKIAIDRALQNRSELLNAERSREISRLDVDLASSQRHVRFDLTASYGLNKNDTLLASTLYDFNRSRAIALQVSVPVFDWGRHAREVEAAEAQFNSAELTYAYTEQQIRQEIIDLLANIKSAQSRVHVLEKTVEVAQKTYEITLQRYSAGTVTRNDLAQAQQRLTNAKSNNLAALIDYQLGIADLTRKTFWDFEKNQPVQVKYPAE
jgi:outer membrane protein TolC